MGCDTSERKGGKACWCKNSGKASEIQRVNSLNALKPGIYLGGFPSDDDEAESEL